MDEEETKAYARLINDLDGLNNSKRENTKDVRLVNDGSTFISIEDTLRHIGDDEVKSMTKLLRPLPKPLEKPVAKRVVRAAGYEKVSETLNKWEGLVYQRRKADHLQFPLQKNDLRIITSERCTKPRLETPLEKEVYGLLSDAKLTEEDEKTEQAKAIEKAMSLKEVRARSKEIRQEKLLRMKLERKIFMQNKSKSKTNRQRNKKSKLAFRAKVDGMTAEDKENEAEKQRITERMSLRHRSSKWVRRQKEVMGKMKEKSAELEEANAISTKLRAKTPQVSQDDSQSEDEDKIDAKLLDELEADQFNEYFRKNNPWLKPLKNKKSAFEGVILQNGHKGNQPVSSNISPPSLAPVGQSNTGRVEGDLTQKKGKSRPPNEFRKSENNNECPDSDGTDLQNSKPLTTAATVLLDNNDNVLNNHDFGNGTEQKRTQSKKNKKIKNKTTTRVDGKISNAKKVKLKENKLDLENYELISQVPSPCSNKKKSLLKRASSKKCHMSGLHDPISLVKNVDKTKMKLDKKCKKVLTEDNNVHGKKIKNLKKIKPSMEENECGTENNKSKKLTKKNLSVGERSSSIKTKTKKKMSGVRRNENKNKKGIIKEKSMEVNSVDDCGMKRKQKVSLAGKLNSETGEHVMSGAGKNKSAVKNSDEAKLKNCQKKKTAKKSKESVDVLNKKLKDKERGCKEGKLKKVGKKLKSAKNSGDEFSVDSLFNRAELKLLEKKEKKKRLRKERLKKQSVKEKNKPGKKVASPEGDKPEFEFTVEKNESFLDERRERLQGIEDIEKFDWRNNESITVPEPQPLNFTEKKDLLGGKRKDSLIEKKNVVQNGQLEVDPDKLMALIPRVMGSKNKLGFHGQFDSDSDEDDTQEMLKDAFKDDYLAQDFKTEKEENEAKKSVEEDNFLKGWGSWAGPGISEKRARRRFNKSKSKLSVREYLEKYQGKPVPGNVIYNEESDVHENLKANMVRHIPYPFTSVADYEASLRAPTGRLFVPEAAHEALITPPVRTKLGTVIDPMTEEELLKREENNTNKGTKRKDKFGVRNKNRKKMFVENGR